ncbi:unnamed protein product [Protopolystoma xenopodis]|uniref:Uncharacterized protein n=1 Tax=Protopolystoma xenopodis TaxID=117903 RepID=A0A3S5C8P9_9PLAT|nr:unnamed protein product [Protopolystoma xenopodis]
MSALCPAKGGQGIRASLLRKLSPDALEPRRLICRSGQIGGKTLSSVGTVPSGPASIMLEPASRLSRLADNICRVHMAPTAGTDATSQAEIPSGLLLPKLDRQRPSTRHSAYSPRP